MTKNKAENTEKLVQVNMRHVRLTKESRKKCRGIKYCLFGNVANAIESGDWWIPCRNHGYEHMKSELEKGLRKFYELDFDVEVEDFFTSIVSYDNG